MKLLPGSLQSRGRRAPKRRLFAVLRRIVVPAALILFFLYPGSALGKSLDDLKRESGSGGEIAWYSRYVSRGIAASEGPVLQPSAWVTLEDFTLSFFGNYLLTDENEKGPVFNEADVSLSWNREWKEFTIEPMLGLYTYPHTTDQTQYETGLTLARDLGGDWRISTFNSVTFAVGEKASYYGELALGYSRELLEDLSFAIELAVSWPTPAVALEGKLSLELTDNLFLSFYAGHGFTRSDIATSDDHDSESEDAISQGKTVFFGIGLEFNF